MKTLIVVCVIFSVSLAMGETIKYDDYESIVDQLEKKSRGWDEYRKDLPAKSHFGIGMSQSFHQASLASAEHRGLQHGGLMVAIGVDLFSPRWIIEGNFHNFGKSRGDKSDYILKEYGLKGFYKPALTDDWNLRFGTGFSARILDIENTEGQRINSYKTPSILISAGAETYITPYLSLGADLNLKSSMVKDTIDRNSVDVSFRVDTHF